MKVKTLFLGVILSICLLCPVSVSAKQKTPTRPCSVENYKNFVRAMTHKSVKVSLSYNTIGKTERKYMYRWTHIQGATGYEHQISPDKNFRKDVHTQKGGPNWASATREYTCNLNDEPCEFIHRNYYIRIRPLFGKYHGRWSKIVVSKGDL